MSRRPSRRGYLRTVAMSAAVLLAGCNSNPPGTDSGTGSTPGSMDEHTPHVTGPVDVVIDNRTEERQTAGFEITRPLATDSPAGDLEIVEPTDVAAESTRRYEAVIPEDKEVNILALLGTHEPRFENAKDSMWLDPRERPSVTAVVIYVEPYEPGETPTPGHHLDYGDPYIGLELKSE